MDERDVVSGPATEFIRVSKEGFERGVNILHALNGWSCDIRGTRAISQAKMNIFQRAPLDGVVVDVTCWGRFYDFFEIAAASGRSSAGSRSTRRIASTRSIRRRR